MSSMVKDKTLNNKYSCSLEVMEMTYLLTIVYKNNSKPLFDHKVITKVKN